MKILLMVKQVPDLSASGMDDGKVPRGGPSVLNPQCEYALDAAIALKGEEDEVIAVSMGPPSASGSLLRCLELGADRAYHLCDPDFAGSDVWATAKTLARLIIEKESDFDYILCGQRAADGETGQVPSMLAELLGIPQVSGCHRIIRKLAFLHAWRGMSGRIERFELGPKALIAMETGCNVHRLPSMEDFLAAKRKELTVISRKDISLEKSDCGLMGSHTVVKGVHVLTESREGIKLHLDDTSSAVDAVYEAVRRRDK